MALVLITIGRPGLTPAFRGHGRRHKLGCVATFLLFILIFIPAAVALVLFIAEPVEIPRHADRGSMADLLFQRALHPPECNLTVTLHDSLHARHDISAFVK